MDFKTSVLGQILRTTEVLEQRIYNWALNKGHGQLCTMRNVSISVQSFEYLHFSFF